jgi:Domain of unknown function (DUF4268)
MKLGRIQSVDIRAIWKNEAGDFTPWLAEANNLTLLGEALHLGDLTLQSTEHGVGDFSADIVAIDEGGVEVLIENQLEPTDHRHLGQVLTYLAGLNREEASIVWVATRFREEHRAAIDWLNRQTAEGYDFFGVEIEVIRIGDSPPAPRFSVVAMPNDWAKQARQVVRRASVDAPSETGSLYQDYWLGLRQSAEQAGEAGRFPKALPQSWLPFRIGRSGFVLAPVLLRSERQVRFELYMAQKNMPPKQAFRELEASRPQIEQAFGGPLDWQELPDRRASRVATHLKVVDIADRADWPRQHRWIMDQLKIFRRIFADRVKALALDGAENINEIETASEDDI